MSRARRKVRPLVRPSTALPEARLTKSSSSTFDVVIAGVGIVGAACAWQLSKAGLSVGIADSSFAGGGATAAWGILWCWTIRKRSSA